MTADASANGQGAAAPTGPLHVTIVNGNLKFVSEPILIGHYGSMALTGTERVMDDLLGGDLRGALALGLYPEPPGTTQVFINQTVDANDPIRMPRPKAVIIVGLGAEGNLEMRDLVRSVCVGAIAWCRRIAELHPAAGEPPEPIRMAATLVGSGGTGITAGQSARLVVQGFLEANKRLRKNGRPTIAGLSLIELYLDRATDAWRALSGRRAAEPDSLVVDAEIAAGVGGLPRPLTASYRDAGYDLIAATTIAGRPGDESIAYTLSTGRARTEVRGQAAQGPLLRELVLSASNAQQNDPHIGRTLFQLLIPIDLEPFLTGSRGAVIEVDPGTAGVPWEMLDAGAAGDGDGDRERGPLAIRTKLLRKLRTSVFRSKVLDARGETAGALVIGEPACDLAKYRRLPGANAEARSVAGLLEKALSEVNVKGLFSRNADELGANARTIINALFERPWRIVHVSGHGEPPEWVRALEGAHRASTPGQGDPRGVVLSNGVFLGPREFGNLRVVPELVFINCCHLAKRDGDELLRDEDRRATERYDRAHFAGNLAASLIELGVRCVIAAGWAVDDDAAKAFAETFYRELVTGTRFMDAVCAARKAAHVIGGNTWAAYQCYGDPDWSLADRTEVAAATPEELFAHVASAPALKLALQTVTVNGKYDDVERGELRRRLEHLERFAPLWGDIGEIADAFGQAWADHDVRRAIAWYQRAIAANDGTATLKAVEQSANLRARAAWEEVMNLAGGSGAHGGGSTRDAVPASVKDAIDKARNEITDALNELGTIARLEPTQERWSLCGSAWKRRVLLEDLAQRPDEKAKAMLLMRQCYGSAERIARERQSRDVFYPALNSMAADLIIDSAGDDWAGFDEQRVAMVRASLKQKERDDRDFWSIAGQIELGLYEAIAGHKLLDEIDQITSAYQDLHKRAGSIRYWSTVRDQLRFILACCQCLQAAERTAAEQLHASLEAYVPGAKTNGAAKAAAGAQSAAAPSDEDSPPLSGPPGPGDPPAPRPGATAQ